MKKITAKKYCCNCKYWHDVSVHEIRKDPASVPLPNGISYCKKIKEHVVADDYCGSWVKGK